MPQPHLPTLLASALLMAPTAACASRQRPTEYPPASAACPQAKAATPAVLTRAFQDDLAAAAPPAAPESQRTEPAEREQHHGHHHH
jgi:hypothetical protein